MMTHTGAITYQQCPQKYVYQHEQQLQPRMLPSKTMLADMLRSYLVNFYSSRYNHASDAGGIHHGRALEAVQAQFSERCQALTEALRLFGSEEESAAYLSLVDKACMIADHYCQTRGLDDITREQILVQPAMLLNDDDDTLDLITEIDGVTRLWVHRITHDTPPKDGPRLRDLRSLALVQEALRYVDHIDELRINYIRPDVPGTPKQNKDGSISRVLIATTWPVYASAVYLAGGNPADYDDMRQKLDGREHTLYFPRMDVAFDTAAPRVEAMEHEVVMMQRAVAGRPAARHFSHYCESCPYQTLCRNWLSGGTEAETLAIERFYQPITALA